MSESTRLLNCPACGAALTPPAGQSVMQCPYCRNSVRISGLTPAAGTSGPAHAAKKTPAGGEVDKAKLLQLIKSGNKIEAIKLVRQANAASLVDAKNAVEAFERGEEVDLTQFPPAGAGPRPTEGLTPETDALSEALPVRLKGRTGCLVVVVILALVAGAFALFLLSRRYTPAPTDTPQFATQLPSFGSGGTGPGELDRPDSIGVGLQGNIYA